MVATGMDRAVGLSYDGNHIYWTDLMDGEEAIVRSMEDGSQMEVVVNAGKCNINYVMLISCITC